MKEHFLHYIWQYQLFDKANLFSTNGNKILVENTGTYTQNSGPDFVNTKLKIDEQLWVGTVEIHQKSSDWYVHHHEVDANYDNVILHVVWEDDVVVYRKDNTVIPTLELKGKVPKYLLESYNNLFDSSKKWILCENQISKVDSFRWFHFLEKLYFERLDDKLKIINQLLFETQNDWEAVFFIMLAKNFGLKANGASFFMLAKNINYNIIRKLTHDADLLEILFLGKAALLNENSDTTTEKEYYEKYTYLRHKFQLDDTKFQVQFFRLHPPNFPNIRLSQLANLLSSNHNLFVKTMNETKIENFYTILKSKTSSHWETHYSFGKPHTKTTKKTSHNFVDLLLINTILPIQYAYKEYYGNLDKESIVDIISSISFENNSISNGFQKLGMKLENALHSQAVIKLKKDYCEKKLCLKCEIGLNILKNN